MNPYNYQSQEIQANLQLKETTSRWLRYAVDFPTAYVSYNEENNVVLGEYFQPRNVNRAPLAIIIHGWGDRSAIPCQITGANSGQKGYCRLYLISGVPYQPHAGNHEKPYAIYYH